MGDSVSLADVLELIDEFCDGGGAVEFDEDSMTLTAWKLWNGETPTSQET